MTTLSEVHLGIIRFAGERGLWIAPSSIYDLFPERPAQAIVQPLLRWPDKWPRGDCHGVYLFFGDTPGDPRFLYVGKSSGRTSCLRARLDGYVDLDEYRASGQCKLRQEWNGYKRPWGIEPRYVLTVALKSDPDTGTYPAAEEMEKYLIRELGPSENVQRVRS